MNSIWLPDYISMDSPLGRSLLGKRLDDEISVALPGGTETLVIVDIKYGLKIDRSGILKIGRLGVASGDARRAAPGPHGVLNCRRLKSPGHS